MATAKDVIKKMAIGSFMFSTPKIRAITHFKFDLIEISADGYFLVFREMA